MLLLQDRDGQICILLCQRSGEMCQEWAKNRQTLPHGGPLHPAQEPPSPQSSPRRTCPRAEWILPRGRFRRVHNHRRISANFKHGYRLQGD